MTIQYSAARVTLAATAAMLAMASVADAASWRMSTKMPTTSVEGRGFQMFADKVKEYSGGKLDVKVYPSEQLGKDDAVLEQLQAGTIHVWAEGSTYLQKWVPEMKFTSAAFIFKDRDHWARFMNSDLHKAWIKKVEEKAGITLIGNPAAFMRGPYRVMVSKKDWRDIGGIQGLKLRMHPDQLAVDVWSFLGAEVRVLGWTEVYESIQRGVVDAVNSPVALVESMKFYEVAKHIVRHDEYPQGVGFMANAKAYYGLAPDLKSAVDRAYADSAAFAEKLTNDELQASLAKMKAKGVTYSEPDNATLVAKAQQFYKKLDAEGKLPPGFLKAVEATR